MRRSAPAMRRPRGGVRGGDGRMAKGCRPVPLLLGLAAITFLSTSLLQRPALAPPPAPAAAPPPAPPAPLAPLEPPAALPEEVMTAKVRAEIQALAAELAPRVGVGGLGRWLPGTT